jgi:hypothetical protein
MIGHIGGLNGRPQISIHLSGGTMKRYPFLFGATIVMLSLQSVLSRRV